MLPTPAEGLETVHTMKTLAIIEQWEEESGRYIDNTEFYLLLLLFKLVLDVVFIHLCCQTLFSTYNSLCDVSIVLADVLLALLLGISWYRGGEASPTSTCFILASASAMFQALPLPIVVLGLLSYSLDALHPNQSSVWRSVRNAGLVMLAWCSGVYFSLGTVSGELMELHTQQTKSRVCEVEESRVINYFILVVFTVIVCAMLPFVLEIPRWLRESNRLLRGGDGGTHNPLSSLPDAGEELNSSRPPLWLSLMLGFSVLWAPFLTVSAICIVFGFGVPAYIIVNVLWVECTNSLLLSLVFFAKSSSQGPYCNLPKNVCMWHICWYLSKGMAPQRNPIDVFNQSKQQKNVIYHV